MTDGQAKLITGGLCGIGVAISFHGELIATRFTMHGTGIFVGVVLGIFALYFLLTSRK